MFPFSVHRIQISVPVVHSNMIIIHFYHCKIHSNDNITIRNFVQKLLLIGNCSLKEWNNTPFYSQPKRRDFCLLVGYYAKRGDKHSARATFESMRAVGIDPTSYAFTRLEKTLV